MPLSEWWRSAAFYQIYVRSFQDSNGDGVGDLPGIRSRLPYLKELGVDALWLTPFYPSPQADHGYDVADYVDVDRLFGSLEDFDALVADAHELGIKVTIDIVPNHTSDQHEWFRNAIADPTHPHRAYYFFRPGRAGGRPNGWTSAFGGPAWTLDEATGDYYLHFFSPEQPDLDWHNEAVQAEFERILRFWLDRGVDGFRIDVAHALFKAQDLREMVEPVPKPHFGDWLSALMQPELHPLYRRWRQLADEYDGDRMYVGEIVIESQDKIASYVGPDQLHLSFNFALLYAPWDEEHMRETIDKTLAALGAVGAPATWVFENHDVTRAANTLRRRRGRSAAGARSGAASLRPAGNVVHLPGPGARARGGRSSRRGTPGPGLPPHERRPERARRLSRADPVDEGAAGLRVHRRRALAADAPGLGRGQRRSAAGRAGLDARPLPVGDPAPAARRRLRLAREPAWDDDLRPRRPDVRRQLRRGRARASRRSARARERARHHHDSAPEHRSLDQERSWTMKTSLGIWAFGNMATRFNPAGYKPELAGQTTTDRIRTAVAGLGDLIDDYEFHYPQELSPENLDEVREALDGHGIYCIASGLHLDPRFAKGALVLA